MAKRKVTAQTRVKLSQAAKKRRRNPKGTPLAGKFASGALFSGVKHAEFGPKRYEEEREGIKVRGKGRVDPVSAEEIYVKRGTKGRTKHNLPEHTREEGVQATSDAARLVQNNPERAIEELAYRRTRDRTGKQQPTPADLGHEPISRRTGASAIKQVRDVERANQWRTGRGVYSDAPRQPLQAFLEKELSPAHREQVQAQLKDPNSPFNYGLDMARRGAARYNPGQRRRLQTYQRLLTEEGYSVPEAEEYLRGEHRGRPGVVGARPERPRETGLPQRDAQRTGPRASRYRRGPSQEDRLSLGVSARGVQTLGAISSNFPDASDQDVIKIQQAQREALFSEFQKNQAWAHETRRANILGQQAGKERQDPDRVVFFTTNLGSPAPSVPSDSLLGQYVIRRRKKMLQQTGQAKASELRGKFPEAVRDMHIIEVSSGVSFGSVGEVGAYRRTGFRAGKKRSPNYGRPTPIGSQIMYDRQGRAMYDAQGNIRYTEGTTRRYRVETPDVGLRLFIG